MAFPREISVKLGSYLLRNWATGKKRFPLVLMLEPTENCNLNCIGCGRIREYAFNENLSVDECLSAVDEVKAPIISVSGGEPLLHPQLEEIVKGIASRKKFVHLCTNCILLKKSLTKFKPGPYMSFVVHVDGLAQSHDAITGQEGAFAAAVEGIKAAKEEGFRVYTNTTAFKRTDFSEIERLFKLLSQLGVDGFMISPAFAFFSDEHIFLSREEAIQKFQPLEELRKRFNFYNTSAYLDFLMGKKTVQCMPWSTPTFTPRGWRSPCYFLADKYFHSFKELMDKTDWGKYGVGNDPRCENCMVHSGFEAALINKARRSLELFQLARRP